MKKYLLIIGIGSVLILSWCGKKNIQAITFDNYQVPLTTQELYTKTLSNKAEILQQYKGDDSWSWAFISSLLIAKKTTPDFSGENLAEQIITNEIKAISKSEIKKEKEIDIPCAKEGKGYLTSIQIETTKDPLYLTQEIIIQTGEVYILSHMTKTKSEKDNIISSFGKISCIVE